MPRSPNTVVPTPSAQVVHENPRFPPVLTVGDITPDVMKQWERACRSFFKSKDIEANDQVRRVCYGMKDTRISDWYLVDKERIDALKFDEYMIEMRANWLKMGWEGKVRKKILSSHQGSLSFWDWQVSMQVQNSLLRGTPSHLSETQLRNQLEVNLNDNLAAICDDGKVHNEANFRKWLAEVRRFDEKRQHEKAEWLETIYASLGRDKSGERKPLASSKSYNHPASSASGSTHTSPLPRLTDVERAILIAHKGCFKCRRAYAGHFGNDCPNGAPNAEDYKPVTEATAAAMRPASKKTTVAAVMPAAPSSVLGDGTDSDKYAPFQTPNLKWDCHIDSPDFSSPSLVCESLIDPGSEAVLIDPEVVHFLGLHVRSLPEPLNVEMAINEKKETVQLKEWVKLKLVSLDKLWTSKCVRAIVAPGLSVSVLLGGPFLKHNKIVIDLELRTCVEKTSGYDLLNPPQIPRPSPPPKSKRALRSEAHQIRTDRNTLVHELKWVLPCQREFIDMWSQPVKDPDVTSDLRNRIAYLASLEKLDRLDAKMKKKFEDRFTEIPHTTDVYHHIKLKNPNQTIAARTYSCPCKYRDAWGILLKQHLDAGRIRPSSSPYASPSFIVPKSDPTVLPHWVNDYRELNANTVPDNHPLPRIDDILADCAKGKIWGKIDITNSFFQTRVHPVIRPSAG
jgi:hypothetical protein